MKTIVFEERYFGLEPVRYEFLCEEFSAVRGPQMFAVRPGADEFRQVSQTQPDEFRITGLQGRLNLESQAGLHIEVDGVFRRVIAHSEIADGVLQVTVAR